MTPIDYTIKRLAKSIKDLVVRHASVMANAVNPPEVMLVTEFSGNSGSALSKHAGAVNIKSKLPLQVGTSVVAVPIGGKDYFVVGFY